jgi:transposase InsO family protein
MSLRRAIVECDPSTLNVSQFCAEHGVSTWFFWDLRRRYSTEGDVVLEPSSRAPHVVANKTPAAVEDAIVGERKRLTDAGLDNGPATIRFHLAACSDEVPSEATIWRILKARGFIVDDPSKRPKRTHRSFTAERANECWQLDDTTWWLADDTEVKILDTIDDCSRLLAVCTAMQRCTGAAALQALGEAATVIGWPERILSDNATAFRHTLADALAHLGIAAGHSRPYHPQTCGKVERVHQTLKQWLAKQPAAATIEELQTQLDQFKLIYNHQRPHRSIGRRFPADVWTDTPKSGPADQPITTPTHTWTSTVSSGHARAGRRYRISVGSNHNGQTATVVITGTTCHVFINGQLIRQLTINPNKDNQPRYTQPGRPPTKRQDPRHA